MSVIRWLGAIGVAASLAGSAAAAEDPLVEAEWLSQNLKNPEGARVRGERRSGRLRARPHSGRRQLSLAHRPRRPRAPRHRLRGRTSRRLLREGGRRPRTPPSSSTATTTTGSPPGAPGCSTSTASTRQAPRRRPQVLGSQEACRLDSATPTHSRGTIDARRRQAGAARAPRRRARRRWRSKSTPARRHPLGRRILRQDHRAGRRQGARRCAPATCRAPRTCRGAGGRPPTAPSSRRSELARALCRRRHRRHAAGHHLLPHRRALQPHLVRAGQDPRLRT